MGGWTWVGAASFSAGVRRLVPARRGLQVCRLQDELEEVFTVRYVLRLAHLAVEWVEGLAEIFSGLSGRRGHVAPRRMARFPLALPDRPVAVIHTHESFLSFESPARRDCSQTDALELSSILPPPRHLQVVGSLVHFVVRQSPVACRT